MSALVSRHPGVSAMNRLAVLALGALALSFTAPLSAQTLAPGEMPLHIEALGRTAPDTAVVPINLVGKGKDQKAADADLRKKQAELYAKLAKLGIPQAKIEAAKDADPRYADVMATEPAYACASASGTTTNDAVPAPPVATTSSSSGGDMGCPDPEVNSSRMFTVTVEDLTKVEGVTALVEPDDYYALTQTRYYTRDPVAAKAQATVNAIANARAEADRYAAAMGYRVVRIAAVSNAKPALNWPDLAMMLGGFAAYEGNGNGAMQEARALVGATYAGAMIDFVIAPK
jgi:uncharacterized protein YggE